MVLALYGGSFNPPHNGHVALTKFALEKLRPDKLIWMPSGDPPHKKLPPCTPSPKHRLEMCRLAVRGLSGVEVSDFELNGGARYTIDTVNMLRERYAPGKIWLLMGSDARESFESWYCAEELGAMAEIFAVSRDTVPVSSSGVRAAPCGGKLPADVWDYIRREGLYARRVANEN
jgi:nicotinate-nucleotide adenylyltransferase